MLLELSVLIEHFTAATAALSAGRRKAGVMAEAREKHNRGRVLALGAMRPRRDPIQLASCAALRWSSRMPGKADTGLRPKPQ